MDPRVRNQIFIMVALCICFHNEPAVLVGTILAQMYIIRTMLRNGN